MRRIRIPWRHIDERENVFVRFAHKRRIIIKKKEKSSKHNWHPSKTDFPGNRVIYRGERMNRKGNAYIFASFGENNENL